MRTLYPVALAALVVSCRLDKLLNGGGGNGPPSEPAPATVLAFPVPPGATMQDSAIKPPVQVTAYDSLGNKATNFAGSIRLGIGTDGSVSKKAALAGGVASAVAGVATFPNLRIDSVGTGYTLTAAFGSPAPVDTSVPFDIPPGPPPPPPNQSPVAAFTSSCPTLACSFSDQSSDPDGSVTSWQWTFGDGTTGSTAQNPSHTYSAAGSYTVTLTVKDNQNASSSPVSHTVQVTAPNQPPSAAFTSSCPTLACSFTDQSSDPDGTIATWRWDFGDGSTGGTARNPSHTYSAGGSYTVTLTVTDNQGAQTRS